MLTHFIGILSITSVCFADVPSRLFAVSHVKGVIDEFQNSLVDFKRNMTQELTKTETLGRNSHKNETYCLEQISKAHNASRKLLNMLVEGEYNGLEIVKVSLENMTLNEISQLWGALGPGGKSKVKVEKEMDVFRETATARIHEACGRIVERQKPSKH